MKKISCFIILIVLVVGIASGCGSEEVMDNSIQEETALEKVFPERKAEVYGVVQTIIGNELAINLVASSNAGTGEMNPEGVELTEEEKAAKQAERQASGGKGGGTGADKEIVLSGETMDVIIPVGTSVYMGGAIASEPVEMEIADIMKSSVIKIWLIDGGEGEVNLAEFVQVITR
ncbi:MAG: hypothetical protein U9Q80_11270 [Bacillota bacterium]|nr:hypothetical protein [Bacillota bacterium]